MQLQTRNGTLSDLEQLHAQDNAVMQCRACFADKVKKHRPMHSLCSLGDLSELVVRAYMFLVATVMTQGINKQGHLDCACHHSAL